MQCWKVYTSHGWILYDCTCGLNSRCAVPGSHFIAAVITDCTGSPSVNLCREVTDKPVPSLTRPTPPCVLWVTEYAGNQKLGFRKSSNTHELDTKFCAFSGEKTRSFHLTFESDGAPKKVKQPKMVQGLPPFIMTGRSENQMSVQPLTSFVDKSLHFSETQALYWEVGLKPQRLWDRMK